VDNTADANKSVNYAATAGSAAAKGGNADTVDGLHASAFTREGGQHHSGQGAGGGYTFIGESSNDTGMFSDADGDLYFKKNASVYRPYWNTDKVNNASRADTSGRSDRAGAIQPQNYGENLYDIGAEFNTYGDAHFKLICISPGDGQHYRNKIEVDKSKYAERAGHSTYADGAGSETNYTGRTLKNIVMHTSTAVSTSPGDVLHVYS
jgi:hypothetical protein